MNREQTVHLLRMTISLLKSSDDEFSIPASVGRDLYDFAILHTVDDKIIFQAYVAREKGFNRLGALRYINHRLNLGIT